MKDFIFDFDRIIDRRNTQSDKWGKYSDDVIPMWVADMDFASPPAILSALHERVDHGVFGYSHASQMLADSILAHCQQHYRWSLESNQLVYLPGLVCALHLSVRTFSEKGDGIVVPGPVYYHLTKAAHFADRKIIPVNMVLEEQRWVPDFNEFEQACAQSNSRMILLCNPHNPGGTVYTREELLKIQELAEKYDLVVVSDEIHCDLILSESATHVPFASLNLDAANRCVTLMAPSKTFNIAGLGFAFAVIQNKALRQQFVSARAGLIPEPNLMGLTAAHAAYSHCQEWHRELIRYLRRNQELIAQKLDNTVLRRCQAEATYLDWIDVSALQLDNVHRFFQDAGVGISDGASFGNPEFIRLNFGCPYNVLDQALTRMVEAIDKK